MGLFNRPAVTVHHTDHPTEARRQGIRSDLSEKNSSTPRFESCIGVIQTPCVYGAVNAGLGCRNAKTRQRHRVSSGTSSSFSTRSTSSRINQKCGRLGRRFIPKHKSTLTRLPSILIGCLTLTACGGGSETVVEIALHPSKANILYIATNDYIFKTRDFGNTWKNVSKGMTHSRVISLAVDPLLPANVYAGTKGDAIFKSFNGGHQWVSQRKGLEGVTITSVVHEIKFVPGSSQHIFAATSMGVFETENAGATWIKRMDGMIEVLMVVAIDVDPNQPQTLYAGTSGGVYRSLDGAKNWTKVNNGLVPPDVLKSSRALSVVKIKIDPHAPRTVYTATLKGLYKTTNYGESWQRIGEALPDQFFSDLILDPMTPGVVFAASRAGVHKSRDGGQTWDEVNEGLTNLNVRALVISQTEPSTLYVGTNRAGLFRTKNGGRFWEPVPLTRPQRHS